MKFTKWIVLGAAMLIASPVFATTYYGGFEDTAGRTSDYDYNDMVFSITGSSLSLHDSTGMWSAGSTSSQTFWNNSSLDGAKENIGYCIYGGGACNGGHGLLPSALYLATAGGNSVNDVYFSTSGGVSEKVTLSISADSNVLGWELLSGVGGAHFFSGTGAQTFDPTGNFVLLGKVNGGTTFDSDVAAADGRSHFAFFTATPEPSSLGMFGMALVTAGTMLRKKFAAKQS